MTKKILLLFVALSPLWLHAELTPIKVKKYYGLQDETGQMIVEPMYTAIGSFSGRYTWVNKGGKCPYEQCPISGKWGVINDEGKEVCPLVYDYVDLCYGDYVNVNKGGKIDIDSRTITGGLWGIYDLANQTEVVPCIYTQLGPVTADGTCWAQKEGSGSRRLLTIVDKESNGKIKNIQYQFYFYKDFQFSDFYPRHRDEGKWGIIKVDGSEITDFKYTKVNEFINGYAIVSISRKLGIINTLGEQIIPCIYKDISNPIHWGVCKAQKEKTYALINIHNEELTPYKYDAIEDFSEGFAWAKVGDLFGLIDTAGTELVEPKYHTVYPFFNGFSTVVAGEFVGFVNRLGVEIIPLDYKYVRTNIYFGDNQFRPVDPLSDDCIQWLEKGDATFDWFNKKGELIVVNTKKMFDITDVIPDQLWNY